MSDFDGVEYRETSASRKFPVVGIGASAGGLEAFTELLSNLPSHTGMAFVLVQHLDPNHQSYLSDLLSKKTILPVTEVTDGVEITPDHVYVIPPNADMLLTDGVLKLSPREKTAAPHLPIDLFFRSLAEERQTQAIGVVLSGTGADGSSGLSAIKASGGITFAQDEVSAQYSGMPLNAASSSAIDFVLSPKAIAQELTRISEHPYLRRADQENEGPDAEKLYRAIISRLRSATGVDFGQYRDTTIKRRISRRMALSRHPVLSSYVDYLGDHPGEVESLYRDILINVTSFFRDPDVFEALKTVVFPKLLEDRPPQAPIRIWVPGCSSGQEAYSIAITLLEFLDGQSIRPPIQIFGTDISDEAAIDRARAGLYPDSILDEVSEQRLRTFFVKQGGGYRINQAVRELCVFARHNIAVDPPFSRLDLISCRNLLIYLSASLQSTLVPIFHYALNSKGFLLLGKSESVGRYTDLFSIAERTANIYARSFSLTRLSSFKLDTGPSHLAQKSPTPERAPLAEVQKEADRLVLGRYSPAGVLVNEELQILQFRGQTSPYLEPAPGEASFDLLKMVHESLFLELRGALEEAKLKNTAVRREALRIRDKSEMRRISLEIVPIRLPGSEQRCFLVLFIEADPSRATNEPEHAAVQTTRDDDELSQLRQELSATKEYLQAIIDQQCAANEELQSANEEIRSSNEELQSTNEELQTAKEELQSTNEELRTVNDELQGRNREISDLSDDLANILASLSLPLVMLGRDLRIRRFTPAAGALLNLIPSDIGRPFTDIRPTFDIPNFVQLLLDVISRVTVDEREVQDRNGRWYTLMSYPYRTSDHRIDGVVFSLTDIHERRLAREQLVQGKESAEAGEHAKDQFLAALSHELRTPLTPILAAVMMLQSDSRLDRNVRESLELIRRNTELETQLIDDLLDVSRIGRGKLELKCVPIDLTESIRGAVEVCKADIETRTLEIDVGPGPFIVLGDAPRLQQVFWNLLKNALKFTGPTGRVAIACNREDGLISVEVRDDGVGIPSNQIEHIFRPFEQGGAETTKRFGGLGLGLSISKAIVELHHGTLAVMSEGENKGSTFSVTFPAYGLPLEDKDTKVTSKQSHERTSTHQLSILLVEDHKDTVLMMSRYLEHLGHKVQKAGDIATALELVESYHFDLLVSDLGLPDGNGRDLLEKLRKRGRSFPAIALSGYGQPGDIEQSRLAGFITHLTKPVNLDRLEEVVQEVVGLTLP